MGASSEESGNEVNDSRVIGEIPYKQVGDKQIIDEEIMNRVLADSGFEVTIAIRPSPDSQSPKEVLVNNVVLPPEQVDVFLEGLQDKSALLKDVRVPSIATQLVLDEIVDYMIANTPHHIRSALAGELKETRFEAVEVRDFDDLPSINIFLPEEISDKEKFVEENVLFRLRRLLKFLNIDGKASRGATIILDPTKTAYRDARAFYHISENRIWVKMERLEELDHEAAHMLTNFFGVDNGLHRNLLIDEGLATWAAWQVKTDSEREQAQNENYEEQSKLWAGIFADETLDLDMEIHNLPAMPLGALFWEVMSERIGKLRLMAEWKKINSYKTVKEWVASTGSDPEEVTREWKNKIRAKRSVSGERPAEKVFRAYNTLSTRIRKFFAGK